MVATRSCRLVSLLVLLRRLRPARYAHRRSRSGISRGRPSSELLRDEIARFEAAHPDVRVRALYKETEELRSGFQAAALAGGGPELDLRAVGRARHVADDGRLAGHVAMVSRRAARRFRRRRAHVSAGGERSIAAASWCKSATGSAIIWRWSTTGEFVPKPPKTTDELVELAKQNTVDENGDGRKERYGLVWNFTEPFFAIPFLTGLRRLGVRGAGRQRTPNGATASTARCRRSTRRRRSPRGGSCKSLRDRARRDAQRTATTSWPTRCSRRAGRR